MTSRLPTFVLATEATVEQPMSPVILSLAGPPAVTENSGICTSLVSMTIEKLLASITTLPIL